ncbi:hypothetical protein ACFWM1_06965 [Nocardia sp. NPDC058379]|uniref:hypothetical protein n=1 Tax=unclassified Nocardia TaxID=2637762 RepID=UPI0036660F4E
MTAIRVARAAELVTLLPPGAPTVLDAAPALDVLVLEVAGGHLTWSLLAGPDLPAAVLDDPDAAQDWLWAVYGEEVALAVADAHERRAVVDPARATSVLTAASLRPDLAAALRRLAYAHWASRWWPASTVDGIPALDPALLAADIDELTEACDMALDVEPPTPLDRPAGFDVPDRLAEADSGAAGASRRGGSAHPTGPEPFGPQSGHSTSPGSEQADARPRPESARADDYALAAGGPGSTGGLVFTRGRGECDWRRCPPGIVDAGGGAVSWQAVRAEGASTVQVSVVAAPGGPREVPAHLRPHARVTAGAEVAEVALRRQGDAWVGTVRVGEFLGKELAVDVFVPGVGPAGPRPDETSARGLIREFARQRLTGSTPGEPLLGAEAVAATDDSDF